MLAHRNGIYYTDGSFFLAIDDEESKDARTEATKVEAYRDGKLRWIAPVSMYTHNELVAMNNRRVV